MRLNFFNKNFFPYITGPGCIIDAGCAAPAFPSSAASCVCETAIGGINELYFIPCTETMNQANVTSVAWWTGLRDADPTKLGRSGIGLGSISKSADRRDRVGSCRTEQITSLTWALKFGIKCLDKTSARSTHAKVNELITKADKYLVIARMCEGADDVLPIGKFDTTDLNWTLPDNFEETQLLEFTLSWRELGVPVPVTVAGLSAVVPKLI